MPNGSVQCCLMKQVIWIHLWEAMSKRGVGERRGASPTSELLLKQDCSRQRERERERECVFVCVCVCARAGVCVYVCVCGGGGGRTHAIVFVCMCVTDLVWDFKYSCLPEDLITVKMCVKVYMCVWA